MAGFIKIKHWLANIKQRHCAARKQQAARKVSIPANPPPSYFQAVYGNNRGHVNNFNASNPSFVQYRLLIDYSVLDEDDPQMPDLSLEDFYFETLDDLIQNGEYDKAAERLEEDWDLVPTIFGEGTDVTEMIRDKIRWFAEQCL